MHHTYLKKDCAAMPSLIFPAREKRDSDVQFKPYKHVYKQQCTLLENRSGRGQIFASVLTMIVRANWCKMPSFPIPVTCLYYLCYYEGLAARFAGVSIYHDRNRLVLSTDGLFQLLI